MEGVTAFVEGPACFLILWGLFQRKPWRYTAMMLVSLGELYGVVLYYLTAAHDSFHMYSRPEPLYFWFYFVIVNGIWFVVPLFIIWHCAHHINAAVGSSQQGKAKKK